MKRLIPVLFITLSVSLAAELPVREVILYKHGVGYFDRAGDLHAGETARLDFKATEMNDVLKSLTVQDSNGKVTGMRYDSSEPLSQKLGEFPFHVDNDIPSLSAFLNQLKGARVDLQFGPDIMSGEIVTARVVPGDDKRPEKEQLVLLLDAGELRTLDLSAATSVKFADPVLQAQLREYLKVIAGSRSKDKRSVYIDSTDAGTRHVEASYMIPAPVWKSSYRLIFKEGQEPTLEGWAIVDNTTGEDWTNVKLALVSGRPISFISSLYEPRYIQRVSADLPGQGPIAPVVYEGNVQQNLGVAAARAMNVKQKGAFQAQNQMVMASPAPPQLAMDMRRDDVPADSESSLLPDTAAGEVGDLFEYRFSTPVTVKREESAMLPFLQQKIGARKLLVYSDPTARHPMNAAELVNGTGKTLDGGPITLYDGRAYAGEALVDTLKNGDKRLISYAVDLGTNITTKIGSENTAVRELHARRGVLNWRYAAVETRTYTIRNVDQKAKTLIIEHPIRPEFKVLNQKPVSTTASVYRFEVKLAPAATESFPVTEEHEYESGTALSSVTPAVLSDYLQNVKLSDAARRQLEQIAQQKRDIADTDTAINSSQADIDRLFHDQDRLRQNINSLRQVNGQQEQVQKYARALADQEGQLATLRDQQDQLRKKKGKLQSDLDKLIETIAF